MAIALTGKAPQLCESTPVPSFTPFSDAFVRYVPRAMDTDLLAAALPHSRRETMDRRNNLRLVRGVFVTASNFPCGFSRSGTRVWFSYPNRHCYYDFVQTQSVRVLWRVKCARSKIEL